MSEATVTTTRTRPAVRLERKLPDPPPVVWRAITDRQELKRWFPCDVVVNRGRWVVGAKITFVFPPEVIDMTLEGEVLAADEPRHLAYTWGEEVLRFELTPHGEGTLLVLFDELPAGAAARNAVGWEDCLDQLEGITSARDHWQARFDTYRALFEPVLGPQEGPPEGYKGELT